MNRRRRHSLHEAETSPDGRYIRFDEKLGSGAYKDVYLCYDSETGQEVAWNTVYLGGLPHDEQERIRGETRILRSLSHPAIISFGSTWESTAGDDPCIVFTTEIFTSGTLKQYINRVKGIKLKVVKNWCRQILQALDYLHHLQPPIIHRDLKCDNIFMNGSTGEVRLGDFGLARARHSTHVESVLGTPEFIAPELYDQMYTESVDVYAFGMSVLEMITKEYPYEECSNAAQIWRKVSAGVKPAVLQRIEWDEVRAFIEICIAPGELRPTSAELLGHPFLAYASSNPERDDRVCPVREKGDDAAHATNPSHRNAAQQIPHLPSVTSPHSQQVNAALQTVPTTANHAAAAQPAASSPPANTSTLRQSRPRSPPQSPLHRLPSHNRQSSQDGREAYPTSPAPYAGLSLNTSAPSAAVYTTTSPTHAVSPQGGMGLVAPRTSGSARPPMISTQHHAHAAPASTASARSTAMSSPPQSTPSVTAFPTPLSITPGNAQSPMTGPPGAQSLSPQPLPTPAQVHSISVEVETVLGPVAHVVLHIGLDQRRKKQVSFDFDFRTDTSMFVAGEMVRMLRLPDTGKTETLIAVELESKLDPFRRMYFGGHRGPAPPVPQAGQPQGPVGSPVVSGGGGLTQGGVAHQSGGQVRVSHIHSHGYGGQQTPGHPTPSSHVRPSLSAAPPQPSAQPALHGSQTQPLPAGGVLSGVRPQVAMSATQRVASAQPTLQHTLSLSSLPSTPPPTPNTPVPLPRRSTLPAQLSLPVVNSSAASSLSTHRESKPKSPTLNSPASAYPHTPGVVHSPPQAHGSLLTHHASHHHAHGSGPPVHPPPIPTTPPPPLPATLPAAHPAPANPIHPSVSQPSLRVDPGHPILQPPGAPQSFTPPASTSSSAAAASFAAFGAMTTPALTVGTRRNSDHSLPTAVASALASHGRRNSANLPAVPPVSSASTHPSSPFTHALEVPDPPSDEGHSPLRRSGSDLPPSTAAAPRATSESLYKQYSALSVAQLKDRIRAKGAQHRLADCLEKKDLIDCLIGLTPLSTSPQAAGETTPTGSAPSSRGNSRPSSPDLAHHVGARDLHIHAFAAPLIGPATWGGANRPETKERDAAVRDSRDPFADLFTATAPHGGPPPPNSSINETPSPLVATGFGGQPAERSFRAAARDHVGAGLDEVTHGGTADPAARPGDEHLASVQSPHGLLRSISLVVRHRKSTDRRRCGRPLREGLLRTV